MQSSFVFLIVPLRYEGASTRSCTLLHACMHRYIHTQQRACTYSDIDSSALRQSACFQIPYVRNSSRMPSTWHSFASRYVHIGHDYSEMDVNACLSETVLLSVMFIRVCVWKSLKIHSQKDVHLCECVRVQMIIGEQGVCMSKFVVEWVHVCASVCTYSCACVYLYVIQCVCVFVCIFVSPSHSHSRECLQCAVRITTTCL